jgi:hypothetical protein
MLDRLLSILAALSLAFLAWLYIRSRDQEMLDHVPIPVQITLAPGLCDHYELEVSGPGQVPVSFAGPPSRIRELRGLLQRGAVRVDVTLTVPEERLGESRYMDTVLVEASDLRPPPGVTAVVLQGRNRIPVVVHRLVERRLPVRLEHAAEDRIAQASIEPASVLVHGPQEVLERARTIPTQPVPLPPRAEPATTTEVLTTGPVPVVQELDGRAVRVTPSTVVARITLQPRQRLYELADVPVLFLCPAGFALRPLFGDERAGKITLRLLGPAAADSPAVVAYVDLSGDKWKPGLYEEPVRFQLPKDFQLAQSPPRSVAFQLVPAEANPKGAPSAP